jgi:hypothetical protein
MFLEFQSHEAGQRVVPAGTTPAIRARSRYPPGNGRHSPVLQGRVVDNATGRSRCSFRSRPARGPSKGSSKAVVAWLPLTVVATAVLDGSLGEQPREVAFQGPARFATYELIIERSQKLGQVGQRLARCKRFSACRLHTSLYAPTPN